MTERDFTSYITAANTALSPFDLEIRSTHHQQTRARIYALVNCTSDPITQLATTHSADEISYLKRVLDGMFETYNTPRHEVMAITSMQAVRLHKLPAEHNSRREAQDGAATQGSAGQGLTMMQGEKVLQTVVEEGWLEKSGRGYYSLSARGLMELRGWLVETYNEAGDEEEDDEEERVVRVKLCFACKEIITVVSGVWGASEVVGGMGLMCEVRARDVRRGVVRVGCMIFARRGSFGRRRRGSVRCARRSGRGGTLLGRERLPVRPGLVRGGGGVEVARLVGEIRRWWRRRRKKRRMLRLRVLEEMKHWRGLKRLRRTRTMRRNICFLGS